MNMLLSNKSRKMELNFGSTQFSKTILNHTNLFTFTDSSVNNHIVDSDTYCGTLCYLHALVSTILYFNLVGLMFKYILVNISNLPLTIKYVAFCKFYSHNTPIVYALACLTLFSFSSVFFVLGAKRRCYIPTRLVLVVLLFLANVMTYGMRVNLSIALVAMVKENNTDVHQHYSYCKGLQNDTHRADEVYIYIYIAGNIIHLYINIIAIVNVYRMILKGLVRYIL